VFQPFVPNVTAAIINNYECHLNPTADGTADWLDTGFQPSDLLTYPPCFFNFPAYAIAPEF
jgi:hypothetical protein